MSANRLRLRGGPFFDVWPIGLVCLALVFSSGCDTSVNVASEGNSRSIQNEGSDVDSTAELRVQAVRERAPNIVVPSSNERGDDLNVLETLEFADWAKDFGEGSVAGPNQTVVVPLNRPGIPGD